MATHSFIGDTATPDQQYVAKNSATRLPEHSQASDNSPGQKPDNFALQLVGADAGSGGVTMIVALSPVLPAAPVLPVAPVEPVAPVAPVGPGTTTGAEGTFTTAAGLSQAAMPITASADIRMERIMENSFEYRRKGRQKVANKN